MTRIASAAANEHLVNVAMRTQQRMFDAQRQIASEQRSADYAGIAQQTPRLIGLENARGLLSRFDETTAVIEGRLDLVDNSLTSIDGTLRDFRQVVLDTDSSEPLTATRVRDVQTWAFHALNDMAAYLNTRADGRYLFAGSAVDTAPVDFPYESLEEFQAAFDGRTTTAAPTRDANLQGVRLENPGNWLEFEESTTGASRILATTAMFTGLEPGSTITVGGTGLNDGRYTVTRVVDAQTIEVATMKVIDESPLPADPPVAASLSTPGGLTLNPAATGGLRFDGGAGTLSADVAGSLAGIAPGTVVRVSGSGTNDGTFEVMANDGTSLTVRTATLTDTGGAPVAGSIRTDGYYKGDHVAETHRLDTDRALTFNVTADHPAFEKAMRAMTLLAQGADGTAGGLAANPERLKDALALLNSAIDGRSAQSTMAPGEDPGHLEQVRGQVAFEQMIVRETAERRRDLSAAFEGRASAIERIDPAEAITRFMAESQALEASFQAIARIRGLSLTQYL
jgi:flagellin-like hook-associated protein FlgL